MTGAAVLVELPEETVSRLMALRDGSNERLADIVARLIEGHRRDLVQPERSADSPATSRSDACWADDLLEAFKQLGGQAFHSAVYRQMKKVRTAAGRSWPRTAHETIRQTLQAHNLKSAQYRGGRDLFRMVRPGLWRLKDHDARRVTPISWSADSNVNV